MSSNNGQLQITPLNLVNGQIRYTPVTFQYQNVGDLIDKITTYRKRMESSSSRHSLEVNSYGYNVKITGQFNLARTLKGSVEELNIAINALESQLYGIEIEKDREIRARTRVS